MATYAGLANHAWGMGVVDVDDNGFSGVNVVNHGSHRLSLNRDNGASTEFSRESGTKGSAWSWSVSVGDYRYGARP